MHVPRLAALAFLCLAAAAPSPPQHPAPPDPAVPASSGLPDAGPATSGPATSGPAAPAIAASGPAASGSAASGPDGAKAPPGREWLTSQSALCTAAIAAAEKAYDLPPNLLGSIAKVESGRPVSGMGDIRAWPWTIDADGQGLFLDSRAAAVAWAQQGLARGVHFMDVGCMQVDWQLHPGAFRSLDDAFDPATNAMYAARYLRALHDEAHGDWNVAVGWYHSHTEDLAADYRNRVASVGAGILSGIGGPEPLYRRAIRQGTLRLALAGGGMLLINVRRQPRARPGRQMGRCEIAAVLQPLLATRVRGCSARG